MLTMALLEQIAETKKKRVKAIEDARAINKKAADEKRELTAQETEAFDKAMVDAERLEKDAERMEKLEKQERWAKDSSGRKTDPGQPGEGEGEGRGNKEETEFRFKRNGQEQIVKLSGARAAQPYREAYRKYLAYGLAGLGPDDYRALQADDNPSGGYLSAPMQMAAGLIKFVDDQVFVRQYANVLPPLTTALSLGAPSLDTDVADDDWTSELATGNEDTAMKFGRRELHPHPMAKRIKVSNKLLKTASQDPETIVRDRLGYKVGITSEKGYLTGGGAQQALGVFTASASGISTGRDVQTGSATNVTYAGLTAAKYALKGAYWNQARWLFHRDALKLVATLADSTGRPLWQPSVQAGQPDLLLGLPFDMSEYVPNTFTTGLYVGLLAAWKVGYWIIDSLGLTIQRLVELYAETNQVGFIARFETDGMPVLEEAFVRLKTN
jgi:HK97 family phage major capsid protein